jgi:putative ABC transport system permease protein
MLRQDVVFAFRQFRKSPGFAATAIISLMLGIGATTAVFSVVYAILLNPYPYKDAKRLGYLQIVDKSGNNRGWGLSAREFEKLREVHSLEGVIGIDGWSLTTTDGDLPQDVEAIYLTPDAMAQLGMPALLGRTLLPSDAPGGRDPEPIIVLGYKFWQRYYNGRSDVLGRTLRLVHKSYTIVGVMPPRFTWQGGEVYLPLRLDPSRGPSYGSSIKLRGGVSKQAAEAELQALFDVFARENPNRFPPGFRVSIRDLNDWVERRMGGTLILLFAGVALMLLIGCANVSILLLARGTTRTQELAVRASVGASRGRIVRLLLSESLALSLIGALGGVLLAFGLVKLIAIWLPPDDFPSEAAIGINLVVLLFSAALAIATGVLFGISPALQLSRPGLAQSMSGARRATGGRAGRRTHGLLVTAQVALTLILLTGAGQAIASFVRLMHANLGYDPHHTMSVGIPVHDNTHMQWADRVQYFEQLREHIGSLPDVVTAGISTNATPPSNGWNTRFEIFGQSQIQDQATRLNFVDPQYFSVLHIPLESGRLWTHSEVMRGARLALVNRTLAQRFWPQGNALGQQIRAPELKPNTRYQATVPASDGWMQIIGVVSDVRDDGMGKPIKPAIYVPYSVNMVMWTQILVRTRGEPLAILRAVRGKVHEVDPDQQVNGEVRNLDQWIANQPEFVGARLAMLLLAAFAILALALAAFGLYSVVSHVVAQRTSEFGIRMALGAEPSDVLRLVLGSTALTVGCGLVMGIAASLALSRVLAARLLESSAPQSLGTLGLFLAGVVVLAGAAFLACLLPARRASSIDPMSALRFE